MGRQVEAICQHVALLLGLLSILHVLLTDFGAVQNDFLSVLVKEAITFSSSPGGDGKKRMPNARWRRVFEETGEEDGTTVPEGEYPSDIVDIRGGADDEETVLSNPEGARVTKVGSNLEKKKRRMANKSSHSLTTQDGARERMRPLFPSSTLLF